MRSMGKEIIDLKDAAQELEEEINELIELKSKWDKIYHEYSRNGSLKN